MRLEHLHLVSVLGGGGGAQAAGAPTGDDVVLVGVCGGGAGGGRDGSVREMARARRRRGARPKRTNAVDGRDTRGRRDRWRRGRDERGGRRRRRAAGDGRARGASTSTPRRRSSSSSKSSDPTSTRAFMIRGRAAACSGPVASVRPLRFSEYAPRRSPGVRRRSRARAQCRSGSGVCCRCGDMEYPASARQIDHQQPRRDAIGGERGRFLVVRQVLTGILIERFSTERAVLVLTFAFSSHV